MNFRDSFFFLTFERSFLGALWRFAELVQVIHPKKIRVFYEHLQVAFQTIAQRPEELIHEKLADYYELIFRVFGPSINDKEVKVRRRLKRRID